MACAAASVGMDRAVVVLGCTGAGKTKMSIDICKRFNGEVVNADAMQLYRGLPIVTNVVTEAERQGVPHHLLELKDPHDQPFTVHDFLARATEAIRDIAHRGKLPVIVGGTNYYIEALLYHEALAVETPTNSLAQVSRHGEAEAGAKTEVGPSLHEQLVAVDPKMAARLHPNDTRKISRSLEIFRTQGVPQSDILARQVPELRFKTVCCVWVGCEQDVLDARLDARVDSMIAAGLMDELTHFHGQCIASQCEDSTNEDVQLDFTQGILQAIGFKEFLPYLSAKDPLDQSAEVLEDCIANMKLHTRRYARKQIKWITNRLLRHRDRAMHVIKVESTDPTMWGATAKKPATEFVRHWLDGNPLTGNCDDLRRERRPTNAVDEWKKYVCESCDRILHGRHEWDIHLKSRQHRKRKRNPRTNSDSTGINNGD